MLVFKSVLKIGEIRVRNLSLNIIAAVVAALTTHTADTFLSQGSDLQSNDSLRRDINKISQAKRRKRLRGIRKGSKK